jgi:hypothetical protein
MARRQFHQLPIAPASRGDRQTPAGKRSMPMKRWRASLMRSMKSSGGFDFAGTISDIWNAKVASHAGNHYVVSPADWNQIDDENGFASK